MKRAIDLVMFDLDGTLADTGQDLADAVNVTRGHFALAALPTKLILRHVGRGVEHLLRNTLPEATRNAFEEVLRIFLDRYESHLLDKTTLYPNVERILEHYRAKRRAVVTNKMHHLSVAVLRGLGVAERFDLVLGGDSAPNKKPHPALLQAALSRFGVPAGRAVMVGDGEIDIQAGKHAQVITCGVTYGLGDKKALAEAEPDFLIDDMGELARYFE